MKKIKDFGKRLLNYVAVLTKIVGIAAILLPVTLFVKPKSLKEKTSRKPGGQLDHKGKTLHVFEEPDVVMEHKVEHCSHCNSDISSHKPGAVKTRQVVDVVVTQVVTEYRADVKQCPDCGQQTVAPFPTGVSHYLQYGPSYRAIMICLNQGNHVPYDRLSKISRDIFGIPVSCGTLVNMVNECAHSLDASLEIIKEQLLQSPIFHVDETGLRVKGKTQWLHNASNDQYTYVQTHQKRGNAATELYRRC